MVSLFKLSFALSFSSPSAIGGVDSGELKGPSNLHGACAGKGSGGGDVGDAITEGSNEKGRCDAGILLAAA